VILSSVDKRPLAEGEYTLEVVLGNARQRILASNGLPWSGLGETATTVPVNVRSVRTVADLRRADEQAVSAALQRKDHAQALAIYQRMIARNPADAGAHAAAGTALVAMRRLPEAAAAFERSLGIRVSADSIVPAQLAIVYFAMGDDARAVNTLRQHIPSNALQQIEKELRASAARLRVR